MRSPGNLGTVLRTSDAVGGAGLILLGNEADPYDPAEVRATMGALYAQRMVRTTLGEFDRWRRRYHCLLVGASPSASTELPRADLSPPNRSAHEQGAQRAIP